MSKDATSTRTLLIFVIALCGPQILAGAGKTFGCVDERRLDACSDEPHTGLGCVYVGDRRDAAAPNFLLGLLQIDEANEVWVSRRHIQPPKIEQ